MKIAPGLELRGDIGATRGDGAAKDTVLRDSWNNQQTGLVGGERLAARRV